MVNRELFSDRPLTVGEVLDKAAKSAVRGETAGVCTMLNAYLSEPEKTQSKLCLMLPFGNCRTFYSTHAFLHRCTSTSSFGREYHC